MYIIPAWEKIACSSGYQTMAGSSEDVFRLEMPGACRSVGSKTPGLPFGPPPATRDDPATSYVAEFVKIPQSELVRVPLRADVQPGRRFAPAPATQHDDPTPGTLRDDPAPATKNAKLAELKERLNRHELGIEAPDTQIVSSGHPKLDHLLPTEGFRRGTLIEWLSAAPGSGAGTLAWLAVREACAAGGAVVVVDQTGEFYPPAAASWGVDLAQTIVVRVRNPRDALWALDQALRCEGVAAVWGEQPELSSRDFRRLQLAAEAGGTLGFLLRPVSARSEPSWAAVRLLVEGIVVDGIAHPSSPTATLPLASDWFESPAMAWRHVRVELLRCRGLRSGGTVELLIGEQASDGTAGLMHLASQLAASKAVRRPARA